MRKTSALILLALVVHAYSAPQLISFKDGKLGVNFGGYHAGVGIGGATGDGAAGGLFAEAGTPTGQAARAGLGGSVDGNGGSRGGLFAGATAGGNVKASTGLSGGVSADKAAGAGFAFAGAGGHETSSGLGGESSVSGSSGFKFSGTKVPGIQTTVIKETETSVVPVEQKVHTEFKLDAANEIQHTETDSHSETPHKSVNIAQSTIIEEDKEPPKTVVQKTITHTHYHPKHQHHGDAFIGGYIGGEAHAPPAQKRIDVGVQSSGNAGAGFEGSTHVGSNHAAGTGGQVTYKKEVTAHANPNFFQDIFNIPISTLKAVSGLLSNTAANTGIKVEKSGVVHEESDLNLKHAPHSQLSSSSDAQITVQTPSVSKFFDDIFAIPINTLGAVNKFLENNIQGRKRIQVTQEASGSVAEPTRVRLGPHARRRANKHVVIIHEAPEEHQETN